MQTWFLEWDREEQKETNANPQAIDHFSRQIRIVVNDDLNELYNKYYDSMGNVEAAPIEYAIGEIAKRKENKQKNLVVAFKESFEKFKTAAKEYKKGGEETIGYQKAIFRMLCTAVKVRERDVIGNVEERQALVYKQFAINSIVRALDPLGYADGKGTETEKIAESWMQSAELTNLNGIHKRFYDTIVGPLVHKCDWHFGVEIEVDRFSREIDRRYYKIKGEIKLCGIVKKLYELFILLDGRSENAKYDAQNTTTKASGAKVTTQEVAARDKVGKNINDFIMDDNFDNLIIDCCASLSPDSSRNMRNDVGFIRKNRGDLATAFREIFAKLIEELKYSYNANDTTKYRGFAYKLLLIGREMHKVLDGNSAEQQQWVFIQFVAGLLVYSLRLDHPVNGENGEILQIALSWTINWHDYS